MFKGNGIMTNKLIKIFTRTREKPIIADFFSNYNIPHEIYTIYDKIKVEPFEFGVSYCYPRKITPPLLYLARRGIINYHPAPLPEYPYNKMTDSKNPIELAIERKVMEWGCTLHYMNEQLDKGKIIMKQMFKLNEPPLSKDELGAITHWHMIKLFKDTVISLYYNSPITNQDFINKWNQEHK